MQEGDLIGLLIALTMPSMILLYTLRRFFSLREKRLEIEAAQVAEKAAQYVAGNKDIEQRLAVLERIVTDQPHALSREIDALAITDQAKPTKDLA